MREWLDDIFGFAVEHREIPRPHGRPYYPIAHTRIGVLHTTEGSTIEGAYRTLRDKSSAPHFIVGEDRIVQCRPINAQASALHGDAPFYANAMAAIQIEMVELSQQKLWLPEDPTLKPTVALLAWLALFEANIPLRVPYAGWLDDCSDVTRPWATNNSRRKFLARLGNHWAQQPGWYMHLEIPGQAPSWHWDCGALKRTVMLQMAQQMVQTKETK